MNLVRRRFYGGTQVGDATLEVSDSLPAPRKLRFARSSRAQAKSVCDERRAIQAKPLDEEPTFGGQSGQVPCRVLTNMGREVVTSGMKQPDVRQVLDVPVRTLMLVAARARVHEVVIVVRPASRAWLVVVDRERGTHGFFMNVTVCAASSKPHACALSLSVRHRTDASDRPVTRWKSSAKAALRCRSRAT
jgi:hypothetical protein